jgi:hypothetical protein
MPGNWGGDLRHKVYRPEELFLNVAHQVSDRNPGLRNFFCVLTFVIDDSFCNAECRIGRHLHGAKVTRRKSQLTEL